MTIHSLLTDPTLLHHCANKKISPGEALYADPYYRFLRIFQILGKTGITVNPEDKWLDLGCHGAQFISLLKMQWPGLRVSGVDQWNLTEKIHWLDFRYEKFDLQHDWTGLFSEKFRFISALEVLEHIIDTDAFLRRCHSALEDGGWLVLSTPNINNLHNRILVPLGRYPIHLEYKTIIHHVRLYNVEKIRLHLQEHGFSVRALYGVNLLPARWRLLKPFNDRLAGLLPSLCTNMIVIAQKNERA